MVTLDPEQPISVALLSQIATEMGLRLEVPPRLVWRALTWAAGRIYDLEARMVTIQSAEPRYIREEIE